MNFMISNYIRDIPDFPKPGIIFKDITPLLAHPPAFEIAINQFVDNYSATKFDVVAAPESRGFLFALPLALKLQKPFVPLRKPGKLPYHTHSVKYELEYGHAELHMHVDAISPGSKVLLIDDLLATGGTMCAASKLIEKTGGHVVGCAFVVELLFLNGREHLNEVFSLVKF